MAPILPHGTIDVRELSATQYPAQDGYQSSRLDIRCEWTPLDTTGILYEFFLSRPGIPFKDVIESLDPLVSKVCFTGDVLLTNGTYNLTVSAINTLGMRSNTLLEQLTIHTTMDKSCKEDKLKTAVTTKNTLRVDWSSVISETSYIHFYEVSAGTL